MLQKKSSNHRSNFSNAAALLVATAISSTVHASTALDGDDNANDLTGTDPNEQYIVTPRGGADNITLPSNSTQFSWVVYESPVKINFASGAHTGDAQGDTYSARSGYIGFNLAAGSEFTGSSSKDVTKMNGDGTVYESGGWDEAQDASRYVFNGAYADYRIEGSGGNYSVYDSSNVRKTLKNVATLQFSDGMFENDQFVSNTPTAEIVSRDFTYDISEGVTVNQTRQCYLWESNITSYPVNNGVDCISFENSSQSATILQGDGTANIGGTQFSFDPSFAVIGTPSGRDFITPASGGMVASGGGTDIFYPKADAVLIGKGSWITASVLGSGSSLNMVSQSMNAGADIDGTILSNINAIQMASGSETVRLSLSHIQKGLTFVNGGNGTDNLYLDDFVVNVVDVDGTLSVAGMVISSNRQITLANEDNTASIRVLDFENIYVQGRDEQGTISSVNLTYDRNENTVNVEKGASLPGTGIEFSAWIQACNYGGGLCSDMSEEKKVTLSSDDKKEVTLSWNEPLTLVNGECARSFDNPAPNGGKAVYSYELYWATDDGSMSGPYVLNVDELKANNACETDYSQTAHEKCEVLPDVCSHTVDLDL